MSTTTPYIHTDKEDQMDWQPGHTAPKDRRIIGGFKQGRERFSAETAWESHRKCWVFDGGWSKTIDVWFPWPELPKDAG